MILLALALAATPLTDTPKAFLERVYASYNDRNFSPFEHSERYFAPKLKAAIEEDSRLAHGEVGYLDGDPICQCQDSDGLRAAIKNVAPRGRDKATASVVLDFPDSTLTRIRISLVRTPVGWRIADIAAPDEPSLLRALEASNRSARAKR
jgi:hypothetical protein